MSTAYELKPGVKPRRKRQETLFDKSVIAQLYDPAVRAGMTRAELAKIIK